MAMKIKGILCAAACAAVAFMSASCTYDVIDGGINDVKENRHLTTFEWLQQYEHTKEVAELFRQAGLEDVINGDVTVLAPNEWAVSRYVRRRNSINYLSPEDPRFTIDQLTYEELQQMQMYIFDGQWSSADIPEGGIYLTAMDGVTEVYLTVDPTNTNPNAGYDGGGAAGAGYQYSNFLQTTPNCVHVLYKRGTEWEFDYKDRTNMKNGSQDNPECDQYCSMMISDVITKNGVVHVLYSSDATYSELFYYPTLFFFGNRNDDK
ncbi:MAG: fasciclin domain-containing protein [Bacteroidales bacterium]|nr:fasciclin domain-containing protein [Bacteroidales bacterium]